MKRLVTLFLVAMMVVSSVLPAAAEENATLTEAIKLAKSMFSTEGFTKFWSDQETYNDKTTYYLYWTGEDSVDSSAARLTVRVDAHRQLITGYNLDPGYKEHTYPSLPKYDKQYCERIAEEFAAKLAPTQFSQMKLEKVEEPQIRLEKRHWPHSFTYRYVQSVNDVAFRANNLWVTVNADTGEVQSYYLHWEDYEFPSTDGALTLEEAQSVFNQKGLKLVYLRQYNWRDRTSKPYLAYVLESGNSLQIDAFTGEISYGGYQAYPTSMNKGLAKEGMGYREDSLAPWELQEIEIVAGLLTLEQAEAIAREIIGLPEKAELRASRLMEDKEQDVRFWYLDWEYTEGDHYVGASARLNAKDGEISNFYFWEKTAEQKIEPKLTHDEALGIAREFLQKWVSAKYRDVELTSKYEHQQGEPLPYSYSFTFERRVNGLPVVGDSMNIIVQHDKRVTSFYTNWYSGEFPAVEGALTADEMNKIFLSNVGLNLQYVPYVDPNSTSKFTVPTIKLVYKAKEISSYNFDPFTGKNIDAFGKEIVPVVKPVYSDISGHWAEADIKRLVDLGLLRLEGPEFKPDEVIKLGDMLKMLADAAGYQEPGPILPVWLKSYENSAYSLELGYGVSRGIIKDKDANVNPEALVSREMFAFYLARMQGYGDLSSLEGIWITPYSDFAVVSRQYQGSVAIVHALGLMGSGSPGKFLPKDQTTRAQIAVVLSRMLNMAN